MNTVTNTVMIVPLICGMTTCQKICSSVAPSIRAASMVSSGTPLIAELSRIMAKPTCSQIRITISRREFSFAVSMASQVCGSPPRAVQIALSRPVCGLPRVVVGVDQAPDRGRADERDRHRHEDQGLGHLLARRRQLVGQHRHDHTDGRP